MGCQPGKFEPAAPEAIDAIAELLAQNAELRRQLAACRGKGVNQAKTVQEPKAPEAELKPEDHQALETKDCGESSVSHLSHRARQKPFDTPRRTPFDAPTGSDAAASADRCLPTDTVELGQPPLPVLLGRSTFAGAAAQADCVAVKEHAATPRPIKALSATPPQPALLCLGCRGAAPIAACAGFRRK
mmetsp:Transcript_76842/g.222049  ORF Transcript_76842/g.222049 Transcript_76842/m.222049 type:complete len:187 (-) Transcript_76842:114-674(-)